MDINEAIARLESILTGVTTAPPGYGRGYMPRIIEDQHDWNIHRAKGYAQPSTNRKPGEGKKKASNEKIQQMIDQNNRFWSEVISNHTGRRVQVFFHVEREDFECMTLGDCALYRNCFLATCFYDPPEVVDAYAGIGMDSISFLEHLYFPNLFGANVVGAPGNIGHLHCIERDVDGTGVSERLTYNLKEYIQKKGDPSISSLVKIHRHGTETFAANFVRNCNSRGRLPIIDLLYLDPPWKLPDPYPNTGPHGEATPAELLNFLMRTLFHPILEQGITVNVICVKTRFDWDSVKPFMYLINQKLEHKFQHVLTTKNKPFGGVFYFHVIRRVDEVFTTWKPSPFFNKIYHEHSAHLPFGHPEQHGTHRVDWVRAHSSITDSAS